MKTFAAILILCTLGGTAARASSFVEPEEMNAALGPSMVALGEETAAETESPSIVAFGSESAPETAVASIPVQRSPHDTAPTDEGATNRVTLVSLSPSIVATETAILGIDEARTAAIDEAEDTRKRGPHFKPIVIRGGIMGDAFAQTGRQEAPSDAETETKADTDAQGTPEREPRPDNLPPRHWPGSIRSLPPDGTHRRHGVPF